MECTNKLPRIGTTVENSCGSCNPCRCSRPDHSPKQQQQTLYFERTNQKSKQKLEHGHATNLSSASTFEVSFLLEVANGHIPIKFATTPNKEGISRCPDSIARRKAGRLVIQSRCSVPFNRVIRNSVKKSGSKVPNTITEVRSNQRQGSQWLLSSFHFQGGCHKIRQESLTPRQGNDRGRISETA